jgi:hypothetical protein
LTFPLSMHSELFYAPVCAPLRGLSLSVSAVLIFALTRPGIIKTTRNSNQINMAHARIHTHASWVEKQQLHIYTYCIGKAPPGHIGAHAQRSRSPQCAHKCIQIYCTQHQYLSGRIFLFDFWRQKERANKAFIIKLIGLHVM